MKVWGILRAMETPQTDTEKFQLAEVEESKNLVRARQYQETIAKRVFFNPQIKRCDKKK